MSVWGVTMMKDEEDVAYGVIAHMACELDGIIVADNNSTDNTRLELQRAKDELARSGHALESVCQIEIVDDPEVGYYQSRKMTDLARRAVSYGADWIVPFDADEIWTAEHQIAKTLKEMPGHISVVTAALYNHFCTALDREQGTPFERIVWRQKQPGVLPKVAFRWASTATILQGNHAVVGTAGDTVGGLEIRHFPYRSWEHFRRKAINGAAAYAATDLSEHEGAHWRGYGQILERHGDEALREVYDRYYSFLSPVDEGMVLDPAPYRRWV